jgi:hypothetical protein
LQYEEISNSYLINIHLIGVHKKIDIKNLVTEEVGTAPNYWCTWYRGNPSKEYMRKLVEWSKYAGTEHWQID